MKFRLTLLSSVIITHVTGFSTPTHKLALSIRTTGSVTLPYSKCNSIHNKIAIKPLLLSSTIDNDERMQKKVQGRKKRVNVGYTISSLLFLVQALVILIKSKTPIGLYNASGPLMVCTISYILKGAAANNRLSSDTYKRLNLYMTQFGLLSTITLLYFSSHKMKIIPYLITMINSIKGYGYGVKDWTLNKEDSSSLLQDFINGCKSSIEILFKAPKNIPSIGYLCMTLTAAIWKCMKLVEVCCNITQGIDAKTILKNIFQYNYFALITAVSFTLKDAADRDRLNGTTFIELNLMSGFVWMSMGFYFLDYLVQGSMPFYVGPVGVVLSGSFCFWNALAAMRNKKQKSS